MDTTNSESTRSEHVSTDNTNNAADHRARAVEGVIDSAVELGGVWARYGIEIGRLALRTQSAWLKGLSELLDHVAEAIEPASDRTSAPASNNTTAQ
jgi:hypothetical protein